MQRLLDRLAHRTVAVFDATWTLLAANTPYDAVMGPTTDWRGVERDSVWRNLVGPGNRVVHTPAEQAELEAGLVADLRLTAARYPADQRLRQLIQDLAAQNPRFVELGETADARPWPPARRSTIPS